MNPRRIPVRPHRRMMQQRNPDAVPLRPAIPRLRTFRDRLPENRRSPALHGLAALRRRLHRAAPRIPFSIPERDIFGGQRRVSGRVCGFALRTPTGECGVQAFDAIGVHRPAVFGQNPRFEVFERRLLPQEVIECFLQPDLKAAKQRVGSNPVDVFLPVPESPQMSDAEFTRQTFCGHSSHYPPAVSRRTGCYLYRNLI